MTTCRVLIVGILVMLAGLGCSSATHGTMTVTGNESHQLFTQDFDHAFVRSSTNGEFDVVMFQEGDKPAAPGWGARAASFGRTVWAAIWPWAKKEADQKVIKPMGEAEFRQVVHIHVLWQGAGSSVAKDGVVTNAAIDWFVIGQSSPGEPAQWLRYQGAGYVVLDEGRRTTTVIVRDGLMRKAEASGELNDPIGPARLAGRITAQPNREAVDNVLADLKAQQAGGKVAVVK